MSKQKRVGILVKSTCCSFRVMEFWSQYPNKEAQSCYYLQLPGI